MLIQMMNIRFAAHLWVASMILIFVSSGAATAQTVPATEKWGEKFNSPGATLTFKEVGRTKVPDRTVITYNLFASGLPQDRHYILCLLNVGSTPRAVADAYLNPDGKVVNVLADAERHVAEDPINAKIFGGKGEPVQFALISDDDRLRAFTEIIPFPFDQTAGPCHLSLIETGPYYSGVLIRLTGLHPNEEFSLEQRSETEGGTSTEKADAQGVYNAGIFPFVKGKRSGKARLAVTSRSCKIEISFSWGEGSYQYQ